MSRLCQNDVKFLQTKYIRKNEKEKDFDCCGSAVDNSIGGSDFVQSILV